MIVPIVIFTCRLRPPHRRSATKRLPLSREADGGNTDIWPLMVIRRNDKKHNHRYHCVLCLMSLFTTIVLGHKSYPLSMEVFFLLCNNSSSSPFLSSSALSSSSNPIRIILFTTDPIKIHSLVVRSLLPPSLHFSTRMILPLLFLSIQLGKFVVNNTDR